MGRRAALLGISLTLPVVARAGEAPGAAAAELAPREAAVHILDRLAFGPRPGDVERLTSEGWRDWVEEQLHPEGIDDSALDAIIAERYPSLSMTLGEAYTHYWPPFPKEFDDLSEEQRNRFFQRRNALQIQIEHELRESVLLRAIASRRQLFEVIVDFWRNHFNIDQGKGECAFFANHYEQTIRAHAFGKFEDLLLATARHPAMLIYLDNDTSQKPLTREEKRQLELIRERRRKNPGAQLGEYARNLERHSGLNENYARELMELHTLGVDNYYSQRDVREVARVLTGWSHGWEGEEYESPYGFVFRPEVHDEKSKRVLQVKISGLSGERAVGEGEQLIRYLARHPGTASFVSWKLCRYLLNDEPPAALLERVATVFRETRGSLPAVYRAILFSPEFVRRDSYRAKFKSPFEYVVSALRITGAELKDGGTVLYLLQRMGQPIYRCEDPTGYFDQTEAWLDPGVLVHRWDFALRLAAGKLDGVDVDLSWATGGAASGDHLEALAARILPAGLDADLREALAGTPSPRRLVGLLLGSPSFQQQ